MAQHLDLERIFPIKDEASARLLMLKADCLRAAGVINESECQTVIARARAVLDRTFTRAA
jgi:hypothetical protein